jgi:hypothetical protein
MTAYSELVEWLCAEKFNRSRSADKFGKEIWARKGVSVTVYEGCSAYTAEALRMQAIQDMSAMKRKPKTARARETASKKSAAIAKRLRDLEAHILLRNRELGGLRAVLSSPEAQLIIRQIEADERKMRELRSLMTEIPTPSAHAGRVPAKHRS